jgi:plasmid stabilization system protein ParE
MKPLILSSQAEQELEEAAFFYDSQVSGLGKDFVSNVEVAMEGIQRHPAAWPTVRPAIRRKRVARFPYALVYREYPAMIVVLAVMHLHRKPDYWTDRL